MRHVVRIDAKHRYWTPGPCGEIQRPGYSETCAAMGVTRPNPFHTEEGRAQGVALHRWLIFLASGKVPKTLPDERIRGRVEGIKKFLQDTPFKFAGGEEPMYDPATGTACTPDLYGYRGSWSWVIDAKRGAKTKTHALQTAAQCLALRANGFNAQKRAALYLRDGSYRLVEHDDHDDLTRWTAIAEGYHRLTPMERDVFAQTTTIEEVRGITKSQSVANAFSARSFYL